jgi:molecular chaperone DnaK (HSP70)
VPQQLPRIFGIDLGTTFSCIAHVDASGKPLIIPNAETERITPSVVFFDGDTVTVGTVAKQHARLYPHAVVEMIKRSMGDPSFLFTHNGQDYRPEEIASFILRKLVQDAEHALGEKITDVVITCPAWFGVNQREATSRAGQIAGLNVRAILNEPTAAAIAYGLSPTAPGDRAPPDQTVLVFDLGGGTFDVTLIEVHSGVITVLCTGGDHNLGGKDWDAALIAWLAERYQQQTRSSEDILADPLILQELSTQAEQAKKFLSLREATKLPVTAGQRAVIEITRSTFESLTSHLLERTLSLTLACLAEARGRKFDRILLVGGATRMPQVSRRLNEAFPGVTIESYDPDEAVAKGAALYGWKLALDQEVQTAVATRTKQEPRSVDITQASPEVLAAAQQQVARSFNLRLAAVQQASETRVRNVTSKTFGIVAQDEDNQLKVFNLICRNDPVPREVSRVFGTIEYDQRLVDIQLMENTVLAATTEVASSTRIGRAELPMPGGLPIGSPVEVRFRLTEQGRLEVTAREPGTGKTVLLEVQTACVMSDEEVQWARSRALLRKVT